MARKPQVHFRLRQNNRVEKSKLTYRQQKALNESCLIYLDFVYSGHKLFYSFGQFVNPIDWDKEKEQVKSKQATTVDGKFKLNDLLDELKKICNNGIIGIPKTPDELKAEMDAFIKQNHKEQIELREAKEAAEKLTRPTLYTLADRFINGEIKFKGKDKSKSSLQNYAAVTKHLKEFEKKEGYPVDFETITLDFFYRYVTYLKKQGLAVNTIAKDISILKVFMGEAVDMDYTDNMKFKHKKFSFNEEETDHVYFTEADLHKLYKFEVTNSKLEQVRDLFIFGAWVGLRFSDYNTIKPEHIKQIDGGYFIDMITQKTKERVIIPCNPVVLEIFNKYEHKANRLPKSISNQKFNEYIKEVCKLAEMDDKGRLNSKPNTMLWETVSSHTCRRSFATNYYLQGFPTIDLMKITGHKTERAFLKYIRVSKLDTAKRMAEHNKKNWSAMMLRVA